MILLTRLPVAGYCDWTFEVGRQSRVGALEVQQINQLCKSSANKNAIYAELAQMADDFKIIMLIKYVEQ